MCHFFVSPGKRHWSDPPIQQTKTERYVKALSWCLYISRNFVQIEASAHPKHPLNHPCKNSCEKNTACGWVWRAHSRYSSIELEDSPTRRQIIRKHRTSASGIQNVDKYCFLKGVFLLFKMFKYYYQGIRVRFISYLTTPKNVFTLFELAFHENSSYITLTINNTKSAQN